MNTNSYTTTHATVNNHNTIKPWDGSAIRASLFLRSILEHSLKNGYFTLLLQGFYVSRNTIIVASPSTVNVVKQYYTDPIAFPLHTDIYNPPNPPLPANRLPSEHPLSADDKRIYLVSPELLLAESAVHCESIISAVTNPNVARRLRDYSQNDARWTLLAICAIRDELTPAQITTHLERIAAFARAGITDLSATTFGAWRSEYDDLCVCLPAAHRLPEAYVCQDYLRAVEPLGSEVSLLVSNEIRISNSENHSAEIATSIVNVLEKLALKAPAAGNAFSSVGRGNGDRRSERPTGRGDPRKLPRPSGRTAKPSRAGMQSTSNKTYNSSGTTGSNWHPGRRLCSNFGKDPLCKDGQHMDACCPANQRAGRALAMSAVTDTAADDEHMDQIQKLLAHSPTDLVSSDDEAPTDQTMWAEPASPRLQAQRSLPPFWKTVFSSGTQLYRRGAASERFPRKPPKQVAPSRMVSPEPNRRPRRASRNTTQRKATKSLAISTPTASCSTN